MKAATGFFLLMFVSINLYSQNVDTSNQINSLHKGSWSLQFQVGNNFSLQTFEGLSISMKYHLSPKFALRFGASFNANVDDQTISYKDLNTGNTLNNIPENSNSMSISILAKALYYFNPKSRVNVYAGIGPFGTYSHSYYENAYNSNYYLEYIHNDSWSAGLNAIAGCEVFPASYLSILAEYSVSGSIGKSDYKRNTKILPYGAIIAYNYVESTVIEFRGNVVRVGLSLYF